MYYPELKHLYWGYHSHVKCSTWNVQKFNKVWLWPGWIQFPGNFILKFWPYYAGRFDITHTIWTPIISIFGTFFIQNHICTNAHHNEIDIKRCEIFLLIFWSFSKVCRILPAYPNAHAKFKNKFPIFTSQEIGSRFVPF